MDIEFIIRPGASQAEEAFTVRLSDGRVERMRIHEYGRVFAIPGLYEEVVQDRLRCVSPMMLADGLIDEVRRAGGGLDTVRVLDIGAGNGLVGENLRRRGVVSVIVGVDSEPEAACAAQRDRPGVYADFLTATLDDIDLGDLVDRFGLTCLVGAGAIGAEHISGEQVARAWSWFPDGAWLAITFHEDVESPDGAELRRFVEALRGGQDGTEVCRLDRFRHRLRVTGEPIYNYVLVARKS